MVYLFGLEVNAEYIECVLRKQNAEQTECMFICGKQNHIINISSKSSENISKFKHLEKH
jgi:hypothetical protein